MPLSKTGVHPGFFTGAADPEPIYYLCLIVKFITQDFLQTRLCAYKCNYVFRDSPYLNRNF